VSTQATSRRRLAALGVLALASAFSFALVVLRYVLSGHVVYANEIWNLVLAWAPLVFALAAYDRHRRGRGGLVLALLLALWLAFLPNAFYLVTELKFLRQETVMPIWFDVAMLTSFVWTGLVLGFVSVYLVQEIARRARGPLFGWAVAIGSFGLCGIGVYVGRYVRLNSWDLFLRPAGVLGEVASRVDTPRLVGMSLLIASFLTMAYAMLYTVLEAAVAERERS